MRPKIIESLSKTREETIQETRRILAKPDCSVISLELDQELLSITTARMGPYLLPAGVTKKVEESRKVIHSMTVSKEWKAEVELKSVIDIWIAIIEPAVRFSFEKSVGRTYGIETTETRGVELTGPVEAPGIWVEYRDVFRTGKATIKLGDKIIVLPFQFRIDFDITSSYAKPGEAAKQ